MESSLGDTLSAFQSALEQFEAELSATPDLAPLVFDRCRAWRDLLTFKLVPHLAGEGCLVVAVAGGTNTGKSTVYNLLIRRLASPIVNTAAATCHPVLAGNARRAAQCLDGKLLPEFRPMPLEKPEDATSPDVPADALLVTTVEHLPDRMVVMDTPDVDSIDQRNWSVAEHIRAAGDILIAVLTGEKYRDDRVVQFFREANRSGRIVVPLMNKANPAEQFAIARQQVQAFREDSGAEGPAFVLAHDFDMGKDLQREIPALEDGPHLHAYLESVNVAALKEQVFRDTVARFSEGTAVFLDNTRAVHKELREHVDAFESRAAQIARRFEPAPGKEVGGLFHEYVQARRGPLRRSIGATSAAVARGVGSVGRQIRRGIRRRMTLDVDEETARTEDALYRFHRTALERLTRDLVAGLHDQVRSVGEPYRSLVRASAAALDADAAVEAVVRDTLKSENVSQEFREHARRMLDTWWADHAGKRRALEALDAVLAVMPAAIAAPLALYAGGVGVAEAMVVAGPLTAQFLTRVMEYQFGDAMFDFLSPWRREQQETYELALKTHVLQPALAGWYTGLRPFEGDAMKALRRCHEVMQ
jgi:hypothetical protein